MKILVMSDSHGDVETMLEAVERETPDMIIHLGDCWRDAERVMERYPDSPFVRVPGNCDFRSRTKAEQAITIHGRKLLLCHGHTYGVKQGLWEAEQAAKEQELDAFLFGHTHESLVEMRKGVLYLNPGSVGMGYPCTYGILTIDESGKMNARISPAHPAGNAEAEIVALPLGRGRAVSRR